MIPRALPGTLRCLKQNWDERPLPASIARFLQTAQQRIEAAEHTVTEAFVPADYAAVYQALAQIERPNSAQFLEWGAGFGVVSGLAAMLGWHVRGFELDPDLVTHAERLLQDFGLSAKIESADLYHQPIEADLVFMYMWPNEIEPCLHHFAEHAQQGAKLLYYDGGDRLRLLEQ